MLVWFFSFDLNHIFSGVDLAFKHMMQAYHLSYSIYYSTGPTYHIGTPLECNLHHSTIYLMVFTMHTTTIYHKHAIVPPFGYNLPHCIYHLSYGFYHSPFTQVPIYCYHRATIHTTIEPPLKLWKTIYMIVLSSLYSGICYSSFTQLPCIISHIPLSHHWITIYLIMFMVYHSHNYHLPL